MVSFVPGRYILIVVPWLGSEYILIKAAYPAYNPIDNREFKATSSTIGSGLFSKRSLYSTEASLSFSFLLLMPSPFKKRF